MFLCSRDLGSLLVVTANDVSYSMLRVNPLQTAIASDSVAWKIRLLYLGQEWSR